MLGNFECVPGFVLGSPGGGMSFYCKRKVLKEIEEADMFMKKQAPREKEGEKS